MGAGQQTRGLWKSSFSTFSLFSFLTQKKGSMKTCLVDLIQAFNFSVLSPLLMWNTISSSLPPASVKAEITEPLVINKKELQ